MYNILKLAHISLINAFCILNNLNHINLELQDQTAFVYGPVEAFLNCSGKPPELQLRIFYWNA